jgi:hypothetical protein
VEKIIEKNVKRMMTSHPELTKEEAEATVKQFYSLAKIAIESFNSSSSSPISFDKQAQNGKIEVRKVKI